MPVPLVAAAVWPAVVSLVTWLIQWIARRKLLEWVGLAVAGGKVGDVGLQVASLWSDHDINEFSNAFDRVVVGMAREYLEIELNPSSPFSMHSFTNAVVVKCGVPLRNIFDGEMVKQDLESFSLDQLAAKSGYRLSSLTDTAKVKGDLGNIGLAIVQERTGIPVAGLASIEDAKQAILDWAAPQIYDRLLHDVPLDVAAAGLDGGGVETLISQIRARAGVHGQDVSSREIVRAIQSHVLASSIVMIPQVSGGSKVDRRRLQVRWAQKKFRERHGKRQLYVPLGFEVSTTFVGKADGGDDG